VIVDHVVVPLGHDLDDLDEVAGGDADARLLEHLALDRGDDGFAAPDTAAGKSPLAHHRRLGPLHQ
jgi:hypothetical protein